MNVYPGTLEVEKERGLIRFRTDKELMLVVSVNPALIREESITIVEDRYSTLLKRREDI